MAELGLMASNGCCPPPGLGVFCHQDHVSARLMSEDLQYLIPNHGSNQSLINPLSFNLSMQQKEVCRHTDGLLDFEHFVKTDSTSKRIGLVNLQDTHSDSGLFSMGILKILKLLAQRSVEQWRLVDFSVIYDLMRPLTPFPDMPQQPFDSFSRWCFDDAKNLIYPTRELYFNDPFFFFPEATYHHDGQLDCNYTDNELDDTFLSISNLYSSKNANKSSQQTMLVPYFERKRRARSNTGPSEQLLNSHNNNVKENTSHKNKKKNKKTNSKERDVYRDSYLHACETLLSIIVNRNHHDKTSIHSLKKTGPHLPRLLTRFSASIAGTGIAVVLFVLCSRATPMCTSKLLSTGLGLGLVWLSWSVNRLRDTVISIGKTPGKTGGGEGEEDMLVHLDRNLRDVYFRAAALLAVLVLRVA